MFRLDQTFVPSLAAEALRVAQGATTYVLKASNASGETAFGQSTGLNHIRIGDVEVPTDGARRRVSQIPPLHQGSIYSRLEGVGRGSSAGRDRGPDHPCRDQRSWLARLAGNPSRRGCARNRYSRAGTRAFVDRQIPGASRLRRGARGICNHCARDNAGFGFAAGFSHSLRSHWFSHHRTRPDGWMGCISILARFYRSIISSTCHWAA